MKHLLLKTPMLLPLLLAVSLFVLPSIAQATGIYGGDLIVQNTGNVTATFVGSNAGYTSTLYLLGGDTAIFSTNAFAGSTFSLGSFTAGTALGFRLEVQNTGRTFFTGLGANNPDGVAHTLVEDLGTGSMQVGWEDLWGGGDRDYNDLVFAFSNTAAHGKLVSNPEPSTIILFGSGLLGLGVLRLRKKQE